MLDGSIRVVAWEISELAVPLIEPFVIACGTVTTTQNAMVRATIEDDRGRSAIGLGEAATLVPVTAEDLPAAIANLTRIGDALRGRSFDLRAGFDALGVALDDAAEEGMVARAGAETALLDAIARLLDVPLRSLLGGPIGASTRRMTTDITIPIRPVDKMVALAREHRAAGFDCFKVKVGRDVDHDFDAIAKIAGAVQGARFRIDANAGFSARDAIDLATRLTRAGVAIECFEQPCATDDLAGMAEVAAAIEPPVIADESVQRPEDVRILLDARAADGVNLKLAKSGGLLSALEIGRAAKAAGLAIMCGGMVETRLGMSAAAHVVAALGGVDFVDLDTAWLLADDPFTGGYAAAGPDYDLGDEPGLGVALRRS